MCILEKIKLSEDIIKKSYQENNGKIFVSFFGGKDSTVLLHLARSIFPNIQAVFSNTTNEDIDIIKYVKSHNYIIWVKPKMNFNTVVKEYGFPLVSKEVSQKVNELKYTKSHKLEDIRLNGYENGSGKLPVKWRYLVKQVLEWVKSNYNSKLCPSIDRIDDYSGYYFGNIRLVTWIENADKGHSDRKNGINNKASIRVNQYREDGVFINSYYSQIQASRETGIDSGDISRCCRGKVRIAGGYIWRKEDE